MQNAEGKMQKFLGDGVIEVQTVGDDLSASQITKNRNPKYGSNEAQTVGTGGLDCGLGHVSALALSMQFTTETPLRYLDCP